MKKTLLILCALLLTAVGANAQTPYVFTPTNWVANTDWTTQDGITYNDNTITVTAGTATSTNVSLQNASGYGVTTTTSSYTVSGWQHWFIVVGTNLSTTASNSKLWWMNGANNGEWEPTKVVSLTDGKVIVAWDLSLMPAVDMNLHNDVNYLDGWICFAVTSTSTTSEISDINFYTLEEAIAAYSELEGQLTETTTLYEFKASDWVALDDHTGTTVTTQSNTISVTWTGNEAGLGNMGTMSTSGANTAGYYVTADQNWFVIQGTGLSTTAGDHLLWWMNGYNEGMSVSPTEVVTLEDGCVVLAWDLSQSVAGTYLLGKKNTLSGGTCFGLKSSTGSFTITDINFYTETEAYNLLNGTDATHVCEANESHWSTTATLKDSEHLRLDTWATQSDEIMSTPFMEYYADGDAYLSDATISHEQLTGLTPGMYTVSMDIRIIDYAKDGDSNAKIGTGTTFNANGVSEDLLTGSDGTEDEYGDNKNDEVYGTYTLNCEVSEAGTLDISLDVKDATYSWIMFKNLSVTYAGEVTTETITWTMTDAKWGTIILPFAAEVPSGLTAHSCAALEEDGTTLKLEDVETLEANTPYILSGTAAEYTFSGVATNTQDTYTAGMLTGTFVEMNYTALRAVSGTVYLLQNHDAEADGVTYDEDNTGLGFYPVTENSSEATLTAYHCYLTSSVSPTSLRLPDMTTAIEAVESDMIAGDAIYDLSGRKVSKAVKGVYIQNGKKVLVK